MTLFEAMARFHLRKQEIPGGWLPIFAGIPPCFYCIHCQNTGALEGSGNWSCRAYTQGIPYTILMREDDHSKPLPYDNGYHYESTTWEAQVTPRPGLESGILICRLDFYCNLELESPDNKSKSE